MIGQANEGRMTVAEQLRQQGREEAREEGREAMRGTLQRLLTIKFGTISPSVTAKVGKADNAALAEWMLRVLTALSAEEVVA